MFTGSKALFLTGKWQLALRRDRRASAHSFLSPLKALPPCSEEVPGGQDARKAQAEISQIPTVAPDLGQAQEKTPSPPSEQRGPTALIKYNCFAMIFFLKDFYNIALGTVWLPGTDAIGSWLCLPIHALVYPGSLTK